MASRGTRTVIRIPNQLQKPKCRELLDPNGKCDLKKAKILKQQDHSQDIPILFISSKSEAELASLVDEAGADGYICKPFSPQSIVNSVRKLLK